MFEWNLEEMKLMKLPRNKKTGIWALEYGLTREDKIAFCDKRTDGQLSEVIRLHDKFIDEMDTLPKNEYGDRVKTVSLKAWLKRNDKKNVYDRDYQIGDVIPWNQGLYRRKNIYNINEDDDFVDFCFHLELCDCLRKEEKYFVEHDDYSILSRKICEELKDNGMFWFKGLVISNGKYLFMTDEKGNDREFTFEELKVIDDYIEDVKAYAKSKEKSLTNMLKGKEVKDKGKQR